MLSATSKCVSRVLFVIALFMLSHQASSETLYLGSIGDDADEEIKEFLSLANHLKKHLKKDGIDDIKTVVASNQAT
ncbi:MAG: hypothetical protein ACJASG_001385, partial [Oleiphilaceae bacterium]